MINENLTKWFLSALVLVGILVLMASGANYTCDSEYILLSDPCEPLPECSANLVTDVNEPLPEIASGLILLADEEPQEPLPEINAELLSDVNEPLPEYRWN